MAFGLENIGAGTTRAIASMWMWISVFGAIFAFGIIAIITIFLIWQFKKYPYNVIIIEVDRDGKIRRIDRRAKAGRVVEKTSDGKKDYFRLKLGWRNYIEFNSPKLVDEIHSGGKMGTLLLARFENDQVVPIIGETIGKGKEWQLKMIPKEVAFQQLLTGKDINEMTQIKKNMFLQMAPWIIVIIGFMVVAFFLLALLQQIGTLIDKLPSARVPVITPETPPPG